MYRIPKNIAKKLSLFSAAALLTFAVATPQQAQANSGAGATILNVATVNYKDASGTTSYAETATSSITVLLVAAAPTVSAPINQTVASNGTATYTYKVSSAANGTAPYAITSTNGTKVNLAAGDTATLSAASITLGASVIVGVPALNQINIPAGSETDIIVGDILIINTVSYEVSAIVAGTAASHTNASTTDGAAGTTTAETQTLITLIAHVTGSNTAPNLIVDGVIAGTQVGEQGTFTVDVVATVGAATGDGSVTTTTTVGTATPDDTITTFQGVNVAITKEVSTDGGATFAATGSGAPGATLTYRITIVNNGTGNATSVVITDPMPDYTTYTAGTAKLDITAAPVTYAAAVTALTDAVDAPATDTFDFAANTATYTAGTVAASARVVLFYQVTID